MSPTPKVTVFIPVYNRAQYIGAAIESVLAQHFGDFELLLIDDGSTDDSVEVMRPYRRDPRVRLACNDTNLGIPKTRNRGVALARGQYLAMLDSDDVAHPERLAKQVDFLDRHAGYALVGAWTGGMDKTGQPQCKVRLLPVSPGEVRARQLFQCCPAQSSVTARTAILREHRYCEEYSVSSDYDLWVRLAQHYKLGNLPSVLVRSRMHEKRVTREHAHRVKDHCLRIIRPQLNELGVRLTAIDVERHFLLLRMRKYQFIPDREYLAWADGWLRQLQTANRQTARYPQASFDRLLGQVWFLVCRQAAAGNVGWAAWRSFCQSPLCREIWSSVRLSLLLLLFRKARHE